MITLALGIFLFYFLLFFLVLAVSPGCMIIAFIFFPLGIFLFLGGLSSSTVVFAECGWWSGELGTDRLSCLTSWSDKPHLDVFS